MSPSSVTGLEPHQQQGGMGILGGLGSRDSPSLGDMSFEVCHGCLNSLLFRQPSSVGDTDLTLQESLLPLPLVKNSDGSQSPDLGFRAWPLIVHFIQSSPASFATKASVGTWLPSSVVLPAGCSPSSTSVAAVIAVGAP
jgi:hypothetical protein